MIEHHSTFRAKTMLLRSGNYVRSRIRTAPSSRFYSDFLNNLPRVGGGLSRFGRNVPSPVSGGPSTTPSPVTSTSSKNSQGNSPLVPKSNVKGNRFALKYSSENSKNPGSNNSRNNRSRQPNNHNNQNNHNSGGNNSGSNNNRPNNNQRTNRFANNSPQPPSSEQAQAKRYEDLRKTLRQKEKESEQINAPNKPKPSSIKRKTNKKPVEPVKIQLPPFITVSNLASVMHVPLNDVFKKLEGLGFEDIRHNYILEKENASLIADEFGFEVTINENFKDDLFPDVENDKLLKERPPVVTIMGHVDHGKTTILDHLRKSSIVDQEFGGITQHIGAFSVITPISKKKITFLDTPGHAAFLKMRERGAIITDIVILVVAADDSVMPQTIEAIKHAKKSGVPIIVAINKCDKQGVKIDKVLSDLSAQDIDIEDYGGETQTVKVSGKTGLNMDKLEEAVITLSEMCDFKAEPTGIHADGWIIESQMVKGMGNVATVLVRRGSVKPGDFLVAGNTYCKVRGLKDEHGKQIKIAGPSTPVQIWGWKELPESGDQLIQADNEQTCKRVTESRITRQKEIQASRDIESINQKRQDEIEESKRLDKINDLKLAGLDANVILGENKEQNQAISVKYIVNSDVFGSAEAIKESIDGLGNEEVKSTVISHGAGAPTESDLDLAKTLGATIFCFNVKVPKLIAAQADREGVKIKEHNIIYRLIEDVTDELQSHLKPRIEVKTLAEVEIKEVFVVTLRKTKTKIAGCKVSNGNLKRTSKVKVLRKKEVVFDGLLSSLKHVKDDIQEARKGNECGISFDKWDKFEPGDVIQAYEEVEHKRFL